MPDTTLAEQLTRDAQHWDARALAHLDGGLADPTESDRDWLVLEMCVRYGRSFVGMTSEDRRLFLTRAEDAITGALAVMEGREVETDALLADECVEVAAP